MHLVSGPSLFLLFRPERSKRLARSFGQRLQLLRREWKSGKVESLREPNKRVGDNSCFIGFVVGFQAHGPYSGLPGLPRLIARPFLKLQG